LVAQAMKKIKVRAASGNYQVWCGRGALAHAGKAVATIAQGGNIFLISSPRVWRCCGSQVQAVFTAANPGKIMMNDGESAKNLATVERACRDLVAVGADRRAVLVAIGGGVVGDVAGFVAASYARGIRLVHVPTTVVAQVDSALGGKTGVNLPEGKNLVGAFYPPNLVLADPDLLATLPAREFRSGLYEVIKYGVIGDPRLFEFLERRLDRILAGDAASLDFIIQRSIAQKARVVSRDEHESGLREILNFGHTFAHALESLTRYRVYRHGEAVGWGMIAACKLAEAMEMLSREASKRIIRLIARVGPLPNWPVASAEKLVTAMQADKKTRAGRLRFVLPERIGKVRCGIEADAQALRGVLQEMGRRKSLREIER
jgi:3-dehydroquinate synthase